MKGSSSGHQAGSRFRAFAVAMAVLVLAGGGRALGNVILDWNAVIMAAIRADNTGPTLSTRNLAILHLAMYDAINSVERTHQPYAVLLDASPGASIEAAAAGAGYTVLMALYPGMSARTEETFLVWRDAQPDTAAVEDGLALGEAVAERLLMLRAGDGSATDVPYIPSQEPGQWRRTPPFFRPPLTPGWRFVQPFGILDVESFVPGPPPALDSVEYAEALNEVRRLGGSNSADRTEEQSLIARFWSDFSYTAMPPGHWHEITAGIVQNAALTLPETARLFGLISIAQADAAIVCWETKFRYNLWRPVTAIQRADEDGNLLTEKEPDWNHYLASPPFPAYTSGHSTFSKASAEVLALFFGTDAISFSAVSDSVPGVVRQYRSLAACADEIGMSRIYGGIHFSFDNREGKRSGRLIARDVVGHRLLPNSALPLIQVERMDRATGMTYVRVHAVPGSPLVLEGSETFTDWVPLQTVEARPGGVRVAVPSASKACMFFRIRGV
jgi:hypothetical protein